MLRLTERCCLFFCLPLTRDEFIKEGQTPVKDFVRFFIDESDIADSWSDYEKQVVEPFNEFYNYFSISGLMIVRNGKFTDFVALINSQAADNIILLTHCKSGGQSNEAIEFYDRMVSSDEILNTQFKKYPLVLDISVCNPYHLREQMRKYHPDFACFISKEERDLSVWLYVYALVFTAMHKGKIGFLKAYEKTYQQIFTS